MIILLRPNKKWLESSRRYFPLGVGFCSDLSLVGEMEDELPWKVGGCEVLGWWIIPPNPQEKTAAMVKFAMPEGINYFIESSSSADTIALALVAAHLEAAKRNCEWEMKRREA